MTPLQLLWEMAQALAHLLWFFWPITLLAITLTLVRVGIYIYKRHRFARSGIADIDNLNGKEFEQYLEIFFKKLGYQVKRTPYQGDYGADLILRQGNERTVVQAKRHTRNVGVKAIQEAVASKEFYKGDKIMVVTNSYFTTQAQMLAKANKVELWGRDELVARLLAIKRTDPVAVVATAAVLPDQNREKLPAPSVATAHASICAACGKQVTTKVRDYCLSHPDRFHGQIYCFEHQKALPRLEKIG